ncbi:MAG: trigger factor [Nitrospirota bacterium]|nr:MAG: trigger factor [Nitrospirota bacterium]
MIKNLEHVSETKKRMTVEIPADVIEKKIREELLNVGRRVKIPGFRPGKAPISLLDKKFGKDVESDVLQKVVPEYYSRAMQEAKLSPISNPEFEKSDYKRNDPLEMTFTVEVLPEIKELKYEGVQIKAVEPEITEEEVETAMKRIQAEKLSFEPAGRPAEKDDVVTMDYEVIEDGKEHKDEIFKVGSDQYPEELSEEIKGKKAGDDFEVKLTFPEGHNSDLKGRTVTFKGSIKEIKVLKLPDIDESFARDAGFEGLAAFKDALKADIRSAKAVQIRKKQIVEIIEKLVDSHEFAVPEGMLENELSALLTSERGKDENKDKDESSLKEELRPEALKNAKSAVLLNVIGDKENVTVSEEEMKEKIFELSQMTQIPPQNLVQMYMSKDGSLEGLRYGVFKEKVAELIHSKAVIGKGE